MKILHLEQGSKDWLVWRKAGIGASDACAIMGVSPWTTREQLLKEKRDARHGPRATGGKGGGKADNGAMARGRKNEPLVRDLYRDLTDLDIPPVCCVHDDFPWFKASLDGWHEPTNLILEIKCPSWRDHTYALAKRVPDKYWPQVQHQMLLMGSDLLSYVSWTDNPNFKGKEVLAVVEVPADKAYQEKMFEEEKRFWDEVLKA